MSKRQRISVCQEQKFAQCHPLVLLCYFAGNMAVTMCTMHPLALVVSFLSASAAVLIWCGVKAWVRGLCAAVPVFLFAVVILPFFSHRGVTPLFYVNGMPVTKETVLYGAVMSLLLVTIFLWFQAAGALFDSEKLLYLTGHTAPSIGLLFSMVFRLLPLMRRRFREIREAQCGMGRQFGHLTWTGRARQLVKELGILLSWTLEGSLETSLSMESRGYGCGKRTTFDLFTFRRPDGVWCALFVTGYALLLFVFAGTEWFQAVFFPAVQIAEPDTKRLAVLAALAVSALLPAGYEVYAGYNEE